MIKKMIIRMFLGLILCLIIGINVQATPIDIEMKGTVSGGYVDVFADFIFGTNTLTVQVWNATPNPKNVGQNISNLFFVLNTGQTTGTLTGSSGLERTIAGNKTFTDGLAPVSTGWELNNSYVLGGETGLRLYVLGTPTAPENTIVGLPNGNVYSNANSSIAGNGPHNPFLFGTEGAPVTFTLNISGVTQDTTISDVGFSFGTTEGEWLRVPEPTSLLLLGLGLVAVAGIRRKFKK